MKTIFFYFCDPILKNIFHTIIMLVFFILLNPLMSGIATSQPASQISLSDVAVMKDTTQLRQIILTYKGKEVAAKAQNRIGIILSWAKQYDAAEREFLSTYAQYQNQPQEWGQAAYYLGKIYFYKQDLSKAKKYIRDCLDSNPTGPEADWANYYWVRTKFWCGDSDYVTTANSYLGSTHTATASLDPVMHYDLMRYLIDNHNYQEALSEGHAMISKYPNDSLTLYAKFKLGEVLGSLNQLTDAVNLYKSIITEYGQSSVLARAHYELGMAYDKENDFLNAKKEYKIVSSQYPSETVWVIVSQYFNGMLFYRQSLTKKDSVQLREQSINALHNFQISYPGDIHIPRVLTALADLYLENEQHQLALDAYEQIIAYDTSLVSLKHKGKERDNDLKAHRSLVKQARLTKGNILLDKQHNAQSALVEFQKLLIDDPNNDVLQLKEAMCYIKLGQMNNAKNILNLLIQSGGQTKDAASALLQSLEHGGE